MTYRDCCRNNPGYCPDHSQVLRENPRAARPLEDPDADADYAEELWASLLKKRERVPDMSDWVEWWEVRHFLPGERKGSMTGGAKILFDPPFMRPWPEKQPDGRIKWVPKPLGHAQFFTWTSKMNCPSWSLPAGPPKQSAGTCPASLREAAARAYAKKDRQGQTLADFHADHPDVDLTYVCDGCYAIDNNYQYDTTAIAQDIRYQWTVAALDDGDFVEVMAEMLAELRRDPATRQRLKQHRVSWEYFRIHDAGDFGGEGLGERYFKAWVAVARKFARGPGKIRFWAPTRLWVFPAWRDIFARTKLPANFTLRPSGLHFNGPVPRGLKGMHAGTTSHDHVSAARFDPTTLKRRGTRIRNCPAYDDAKRKSDSCLKNAYGPCRTCWDDKRREVNYKAHF